MPLCISDRAIARRLAKLLHGPTGFRCPTCGHDQAWEYKCRPLIRKCKRCRGQRSMLSGTLLQDTKVELRVWLLRIEYYEEGAIPSCREFAEHAGVSPSTAWEINHKFMAAVGFDRLLGPRADAGDLVFRVKCRGPKGGPLGPHASEWLKTLHGDHREMQPKIAVVRLNFRGELVTLDDPALSPKEQIRPPRFGGMCELKHRGLDRWMRSRLERTHGSVSLRWLGRWVAHLCVLWSSSGGRRTPIPAGIDVLALGTPVPLRQLVPYVELQRNFAVGHIAPPFAPPYA